MTEYGPAGKKQGLSPWLKTLVLWSEKRQGAASRNRYKNLAKRFTLKLRGAYRHSVDMAKRNRTPNPVAVAALAVDIGGAAAPTEFRLIPAGKFSARDGRPRECGSWSMTEEDGLRIVADLAAQADDLVIDYEHATLRARETGTKAPAAGWFKKSEWREDGLWLTGVDWTALASEEIATKAYRYISPVFTYDQKTGRVLKVFHAALTNCAGVDGLTDLAALAAEVFNTATPNPTETPLMEELLEKLQWMLNMPVGSTPEDILAQLQKLVDQIKAMNAPMAANGFDISEFLANANTQIASLTAQIGTADPEKFVPMAVVEELRTANAALSAQVSDLSSGGAVAALNTVIEGALAAGKLTPAMESWARDLGTKNLASLQAFIDTAPAVVKPGASQTAGVSVTTGTSGVAALSADIKKICSQLGVSEAEYIATAQAEAAA